MIENVSRSAPALVPLFRSEQQLRLLAVLFAEPVDELTIGDLAVRAGVAQATASREVARLAEHAIVVTRGLGRNKLVVANWQLPWARELRSILVQTVGVLGRLADALGGLGGVKEAFVYGSWAARYEGEPGPPPRDIDVLVVGEVQLHAVRRACRAVETELRVDVNPVVVDESRWAGESPDPFVAQVRSGPLVPIPIEGGS
jgi:predicted nucleotidyltransferase